jgi:hypothetical protein
MLKKMLGGSISSNSGKDKGLASVVELLAGVLQQGLLLLTSSFLFSFSSSSPSSSPFPSPSLLSFSFLCLLDMWNEREREGWLVVYM